MKTTVLCVIVKSAHSLDVMRFIVLGHADRELIEKGFLKRTKTEIQVTKMKKSTKKWQELKNLYSLIFNSVKENHKMPQTDVSQQKISYHTKALKKAGLIKHLGNGTWTVVKDDLKKFLISEEQKRQQLPLTHATVTQMDKRGHAYSFKLILPKIKNWQNREKYLRNQNISYKLLNKGSGQRIEIENHKIHLFDSKIIIYFPPKMNFLGDTAKNCYEKALEHLYVIIKKLEKLLNYKFSDKKGFHFTVSKHHYAWVDNIIARIYSNAKRKLKIVKDGIEWLIIDHSEGLPEIDTICLEADDDLDKVLIEMFNGSKTYFQKTGEVFSIPELANLLGGMIKIQSSQQKQFSEQINQITSSLNVLLQLHMLKKPNFPNNKSSDDGEKPNYFG